VSIIQKIFFVIFFVFISFPWINTFIPLVKDTVATENRALAKLPEFDTCEIEKIPFYLENYLVDHLSTRNKMIHFYNRLNVFVFKSGPPGIKAFIGKENWLFLSGEELKTFTGTELFNEHELEEFKAEMLRRQKIISSYNAKLLIAIVPNKANIYPEYMPDHIIKAERYGYGEQMTEYLKENKLPVIDLYSILSQHKKPYDIYFKTDNHWNDLGAFVATNAILEKMKLSFPAVTLLDTLNYPIKKSREKDGSIAKMMGMEGQTTDLNYSPTSREFVARKNDQKKYEAIKGFPYPDEYEISYQQHDTSLPKVLLIRDSFGKRLMPYLAERCCNMTCIWDAWHYGLNEAIIKDAKPNFVIYLISESQLKNVMKF
jgi:alginate O-acetyltransferase complex protein AlgJ